MSTLLYRIITHPAVGGVLLFCSTFVAIVMANTDACVLYSAIITFPRQYYSSISSQFSLLTLVNEGLMTVFFLTVGLEIKYELLQGTINSRSQAIFPAIAALGGMVMPTMIYNLVTVGIPELHVGWAIPVATDIAFAVGLLTLLGGRVPVNLKFFLLTLAVIDDLGTIVIIALFYNNTLNPIALVVAGSVISIMMLMNYANIYFLSINMLLGIVLWGCLLLSGIHAALAGVILGGCIPLKLPTKEVSPLCMLEQRLKPWVVYLILPLFAFINSGISLKGITLENLVSLLPMGIAAGLVIGKPLGIVLFIIISMKLRLTKLPAGTNLRQIFATSVLCGVGFTMSIFIANLAFGYNDNQEMIILAKIGILFGSAIAACLGCLLLHIILPKNYN